MTGLFWGYVIKGQFDLYDVEFNITNVCSTFNPCDLYLPIAQVSIYKIATFCGKTLYLNTNEVERAWSHISTTLSDTTTWNTMLPESMMSSQFEPLFVHNLSNLKLQNSSNRWWDSIDICWKRSISWNQSRYASGSWYHLDCIIRNTGSPDVIFMIYRQLVRHPSEHGAWSMKKDLQWNMDITKWN